MLAKNARLGLASTQKSEDEIKATKIRA